MQATAFPLDAFPGERATETRNVRDVFVQHGAFLWRTLQRLGVAPSDLDDTVQEVLIVVHNRLADYDPKRAKMTTWLFGICVKVAQRWHRHSRRRAEPLTEPAAQPAEGTPEEELARRRARRCLARILDEMSLEKRATFVMFELEGMSAAEIAEVTGVPVGTVHSRLFAARQQFASLLRRLQITGEVRRA